MRNERDRQKRKIARNTKISNMMCDNCGADITKSNRYTTTQCLPCRYRELKNRRAEARAATTATKRDKAPCQSPNSRFMSENAARDKHGVVGIVSKTKVEGISDLLDNETIFGEDHLKSRQTDALYILEKFNEAAKEIITRSRPTCAGEYKSLLRDLTESMISNKLDLLIAHDKEIVNEKRESLTKNLD
jgi:DNA-directed RNA polymerase subunit RPC12/RpoP